MVRCVAEIAGSIPAGTGPLTIEVAEETVYFTQENEESAEDDEVASVIALNYEMAEELHKVLGIIIETKKALT